jgi:hypothetical protein
MHKSPILFVVLLLLSGIPGCESSQVGRDSALVKNGVSSNVQLSIQDKSSYHVYAPGKAFTVKVTADYHGPARLSYYWKDFQGRQLSKPTLLPSGQKQTIHSPDNEIGYYGLVLKPNDHTLVLPGRQAGEAREYGFVILPANTESKRQVDSDSPFGIVHAKLDDPYLPPWVKTITWKTFTPTEWLGAMQRRRALGLLELPIILGDEWESDDKKPISPQQLSDLKKKIGKYFSADPGVLYWELGLEENITHRFREPFYWQNLEAKAKTVRQIADRVNPEIKLIYQVAELDLKPVRLFLQSNAANYFDVLSLHPYAWPDFKSPDLWLPGYLNKVRQLLKLNMHQHMSIWMTEAGAPQHDNTSGRFFRDPQSGKMVQGLNARSAVNYLIKLHVLALTMGVKKVFWYNYQDRGMVRDSAEDHFGLRDYWGYPKPVYAAYINLKSLLYKKPPLQTRKIAGHIWVCAFRGKTETVLVVWSDTKSERLLDIPSLQAGLEPTAILRIVNAVGTPLSSDNLTLHLSTIPIFILLKNK